MELNFNDFFDLGEQFILAQNPDIDPQEIRREGSDANVVIASAAIMADQVWNEALKKFRQLYKKTASGDGLYETGYDRCGLTHIGKTVSRGYLTFYRNDDSYGDISLAAGIIASDDSGKTYKTVGTAGLSGLTPINVPAISMTAGALSNAANGKIKMLMSKLDDKAIRVTNAIALARFTRSTSLTAGTIPAGTQVQDGEANTYLTMEPLNFIVGQTIGLVPLKIAAGQGYNTPIEADTITVVVDDLFDTFTVTNPIKTGGAFSGGDDEESEAHYKERWTAFELSSKRATLPAIQYCALSVEGVKYAQVFEIEHDGTPTTRIYCVVADRNGIGNDALVDAVRTAMNEYRGAGVYIYFRGGAVDYQNVSLKFYIKDGYDAVQKQTEVSNVIMEYYNSLPPSTGIDSYRNMGRVEVSEIVKRLKMIEGISVPADAVVLPAADYTPALGNSARVNGSITIEVL